MSPVNITWNDDETTERSYVASIVRLSKHIERLQNELGGHGRRWVLGDCTGMDKEVYIGELIRERDMWVSDLKEDFGR